jgi:heterotetrameric sarcosine oxidase gamma subunit
MSRISVIARRGRGSDLAGAMLAIARRGRGSDLAGAMLAEFELALPQPGRFVACGGLELLWSAPGHYVLQGRAKALLERAEHTLTSFAGVFDVSDAVVAFRCAGPSVREGLRRLLPIDLDAAEFGPGCLAYTVAAHMSVQVRVLDDTPSYELVCRRSESESFRHHLELCVV